MSPTGQLSTGLFVRSKKGVRLRDLTVYRLVKKMRAAMPWLEDSDEPTCRGWAQLEVIASRIYAELRVHGFVNDKGEPRTLLVEFRQMRSAQLRFERELGMTPASRVAMKGSGTRAAFDLPAMMAKADDDEEE
jgi:hypothetical protein